MKAEFNQNGFSSSMEHDFSFPKTKKENPAIGQIVGKNSVILFGILSTILSFLLIPLAFVANILNDILQKALGAMPSSYLLLFLSVALVMALCSICFGIISIVLYGKSNKHNTDTVGLILSILSFVLCAIVMTFGIVTILT